MMDIWFKINVTVLIVLALMLVVDRVANGDGESDGAAATIGGLLAWFLIFSWPAYWLSLLWA